MSTQIGRISGPLLKDNLLRDGVDLAFETDLLYLDVNNNRIGIKSDAPTRDFFVDNTINTTNLIVDNNFLIASNLSVSASSSVSTTFGDLIFDNDIVATRLGVGNLEFDNNTITHQNTNNDIELRPDGTGIVKIFNQLDVYGNIHSTGDITVDGNLIIGTDSSDVIVFNSDVASNIVPDQTDTYKFGDNGRRWNNMYANLLNGQILTVDDIVPGSGTLPATRQGNIWYVMANGNNSNVGDHPNGGFATLEKALSVAGSGDIVFVYPGIYEELLPLVIPEGVFVKGMDMMNTIIKPDTASTHEDVFLLNGQSTISDITIKDFYYDSINNKGYAFRFAPSIKVTSRSPYIQNCLVTTRGSITSISDPLGFDQGDAGKGAYIDGAVAISQTVEASMLFHSVTFITPGVDALTMINGVRIEWINCFTYFANRGMYALRGTGRLTEDGSTLKYGADLRSIGSACVYGNFGAEADGADTIIHLVDHNFAYIGAGKDSTNDKTLAIQSNETIELNTGKIYYTSIDHKGEFRVGNTFFVDLESGATSININTIIGNDIGLDFTDNGQRTYFDPTKFETGNIRFQGNTILSITGPINIVSASGEINLDQNVNIFKDLNIDNDLNIDGTLTLGNQTSDNIIIVPKINENFEPKFDNLYKIGSQSKNWNRVFSRAAYISDIKIDTNFITTTTSNADLELRTSGTGAIWLEDIRVNQNNISTDFDNISIQPATTLDITASTTTVNGNVKTIGNLDADGDTIFGLTSSQSAFFIARIDSNIEPDIADVRSLGNTIQSWNLYASQILLDNIEIQDNFIRTTASNLDLELKSNGVGSVLVEKTRFNENIISTDTTNLELRPNTTLDIYGNTTTNGNLRVTGDHVIDSSITFGLTSSQTVNFVSLIDSNIEPDIADVRSLGNTIQSWNLYASQILLDNIEIQDNFIRTTASNLDLELKSNGTGAVRIEQVNFNENVLRTIGATNLVIDAGSTLDIYANTQINGNLNIINNFNFDGSITFGSAGNVVQVIGQINSDIIPDTGDTYNIGSPSKRWKNISIADAQIDDIEIFTNYIRTISSNSDLELYGNGTGGVLTESLRFRNNAIESSGTNQTIQMSLTGSSIVDINTDTAIRIPRGPTITMTTGSIRFNTSDNLFSGQTTARTTFGGVYSENRQTFARVEPLSNTITFRIGATTAITATTAGLATVGLNVDDITFNNNVVSTNNTNLVLDPDASNTVDIDNFRFDDNQITNLSNSALTVASTGAGYLKFNSTLGMTIPAGDNSQRSLTPEQGTTRWNTEQGYMEIYINNTWQISTSAGTGFATLEEISEIGDVWSLILG